jgi:hypothetical protein
MLSLFVTYFIATVCVGTYAIWLVFATRRAARHVRQLQTLIPARMTNLSAEKVA